MVGDLMLHLIYIISLTTTLSYWITFSNTLTRATACTIAIVV